MGTVHSTMSLVVLLTCIATLQSAGAANMKDCCLKKTVGGESYSLVKKDKEFTSMYGCPAPCIYEKVGSPGSKFCFKPGDLEVECQEMVEGLRECKDANYTEMWTATGEVPTKLNQAPPDPLCMKYNGKTIMPNDTVTTEDMFDWPELAWKTEPAALYTIVQIDFGIERLEGLQFFHWLMANVENGHYLKKGEEIREYIAPFAFVLANNGTTLDPTQGEPIHDVLTLVYKQNGGKVNMTDEKQFGCEGIFTRIGDHVALAEKYDLTLVAGNFLFTTYTEGVDKLLCYFSKCQEEQWPVPAPGINDGPDCQ